MNNQQVLDFTNKTEVHTTCYKGVGHCYQVLSTACGVDGGDSTYIKNALAWFVLEDTAYKIIEQ